MTIREVQYSDDTMNHNLESYEVISSNDLCVSEILEYLQVELGPSLGSSSIEPNIKKFDRAFFFHPSKIYSMNLLGSKKARA